MIRSIFILVLSIAQLTALAEDALPRELPPDQESAAIAAAETTGLAIYRHDRAASLATDAAFKLPRFKEDRRIEGWITEEQSDQIVVTFIDQTPTALYRVAVSNSGIASPVTVLETPTTLTRFEAGAAVARAAAVATKFQPCADKYNSVVLPSSGSSESNWLVYLIPGTTRNDLVPIGGAFRMQARGADLVSQRGFTKTCIALQTDPKSVGLMVSHLLDPIPTEVHVFWSLWAKTPIYVATPPNGTIWVVNGNKIRLIERKASKS